METISLFNAKTHFSQLVEQIASGVTEEIVIARHGQPVARLVPIAKQDIGCRIGIAAGEFDVPDDIDRHKNTYNARFFVSLRLVLWSPTCTRS
jgi:prevent-host-death family protein